MNNNVNTVSLARAHREMQTSFFEIGVLSLQTAGLRPLVCNGPQFLKISVRNYRYVLARVTALSQCVIVYNSKRFSISCRDLRIPQCVIVYNSKKFLLL